MSREQCSDERGCCERGLKSCGAIPQCEGVVQSAMVGGGEERTNIYDVSMMGIVMLLGRDGLIVDGSWQSC
jgi:hypothetical protein